MPRDDDTTNHEPRTTCDDEQNQQKKTTIDFSDCADRSKSSLLRSWLKPKMASQPLLVVALLAQWLATGSAFTQYNLR